MAFVIIGVLVVAICILVVYNLQIQKKIEAFNNINERINNLSILQEFMKIAGQEESVEDKLAKINEIVIEKYDIKYSTIVVFNGAEYQVKASNVEHKHWNTLSKLQEVPIFKDSIATATPKYVTVNNEKIYYDVFESERDITHFKSLHSKCYGYINTKGELKLTIAGIPARTIIGMKDGSPVYLTREEELAGITKEQKLADPDIEIQDKEKVLAAAEAEVN